ncbi:MAG: VacJ family lipoprotein [Syntrophobacterales bacterium]|nr:VacJ family lipoprotein [Syntrophobacterales bacterium]
MIFNPRLSLMVAVIIFISSNISHAQTKTPNSFEEFEEEVIVSDPLEPINRFFGTFNDRLYFWVIKPVSIVYKTVLPIGVRQGIANTFDNIRAPIRIFNNLFQGKTDWALIELQRFMINSTLGVGGFFDVAKFHFGLDKKEEDFGQTLATYSVKDGPYIVWPILGPSTARDSLGMIVDILLDPLTYIIPNWQINAEVKASEITNYSSMRIGEYEDLKKSALDPYIAIRDAYIQNRQKKIRE